MYDCAMFLGVDDCAIFLSKGMSKNYTVDRNLHFPRSISNDARRSLTVDSPTLESLAAHARTRETVEKLGGLTLRTTRPVCN